MLASPESPRVPRGGRALVVPVGGSAAGAVVAFGALLLGGSLQGEETMGRALVLSGIVALIGGGVGGSLEFYGLAQHRRRPDASSWSRYIAGGAVYGGMLGGVVAMVIALATHLRWFDVGVDGPLLLAIVPGSAAQSAATVYGGFVRVFGQDALFIVSDRLLRSTTQLASVLLGALLARWLTPAIWATSAAAVVAAYVWRAPCGGRFRPARLRTLCSPAAVHKLGSDIARLGLNRLDVVVLGAAVGPAAVYLWGVIQRLAQGALLLLDAVGQVTVGRIVREASGTSPIEPRHYTAITRPYRILGSALAVALTILGPWVAARITSVDVGVAATIVVPLALALAWSASVGTAQAVSIIEGGGSLLVWVSWVSLACMVAGGFLVSGARTPTVGLANFAAIWAACVVSLDASGFWALQRIRRFPWVARAELIGAGLASSCLLVVGYAIIY